MPDMISQNGKGKMESQAQPEAGETAPHQDVGTAIFSIVYLILTVFLFAWELFDTWVGQHSLPRLLGYNLVRLDTPDYRLVVYTILGGALGGSINGIRSCIQNYSIFDKKFLWKYITAPVMGGTLGLFVYALVHTSTSMLGGGNLTIGVGTAQALSNFAVGVLSGYGSKDVFIWLDSQVQKLFQPSKQEKVEQTSTVTTTITGPSAALPGPQPLPAAPMVEIIPPEETAPAAVTPTAPPVLSPAPDNPISDAHPAN